MTSFTSYNIIVKDGVGNAFNMLGMNVGSTEAPQILAASSPFDVDGNPLFYTDNPGSISFVDKIVTASFTRPANTVPYGNGSIVANSQTPGSVVPMSWAVMRKVGGTCRLGRARLTKSGIGIGNAQFRVWLFRTTPTSITNGDGGTLACSNALDYVGSYTFDMTGSNGRVFGDGAKVIAVPDVGTDQLMSTPTDSDTIYGLLQCLNDYTPVTSEVFTLALEVRQN